MVLPIYLYGESVLRKRCEDIDFASGLDLKTLIKNMFDTMDKAEGIGLAAPQIGLAYRVFIVNGKPLKKKELKNFRQAFINPKILEESGKKWAYKEGCLSLPNVNVDINRKATVKIQYFDEAGNLHNEVFEGLKARIIQHEYDHIEGRLLVDYLSVIQKNMLRTKLNNISKGNIKVNYPVAIKGKIIR